MGEEEGGLRDPLQNTRFIGILSSFIMFVSIILLKFHILIFLLMAFLSFASVNINGLRNEVKRNVFFDYLQRRKYSLIFVQETHSVAGDELVWSKQWKGKKIFSHGNSQSRGVAILINEKSGLDVININKDSEGRWINGEIKWKNTNLNIASVYAPNEAYARAHFFNDLEDLIDDNDWVIGGDFNCNIDNNRIKDVSKIILRNVLQEKDLFDVWNTVYPNGKGYRTFKCIFICILVKNRGYCQLSIRERYIQLIFKLRTGYGNALFLFLSVLQRNSGILTVRLIEFLCFGVLASTGEIELFYLKVDSMNELQSNCRRSSKD